MSTSRVKWPTVGKKGGNQEEHVHPLKTEAQQLMATMKAPTPEDKKYEERAPPRTSSEILEALARLGPEGGRKAIRGPYPRGHSEA
jgi:hypothetical protein